MYKPVHKRRSNDAVRETMGLLVAIFAFAFQLAETAHGLIALARALFRRFFMMSAQLHFPKNAFALHFLFQYFQSLIDIVITYDDLDDCPHPFQEFCGYIKLRQRNFYHSAEAV